MKVLKSVATLAAKGKAAVDMKRLDAAARRYRLSPLDSLHGTVRWLLRAQDSSPDDGVSYGYSMRTGWAVSYPETTGYILQTLLDYADAFPSDDLRERARRMAHWEASIQMPDGATPGGFGTARPVPVAFNTGQVLLGWAAYLRRVPEDAIVRSAAIRAGEWLLQCMGGKSWFDGGVSSHAEHGDLSYNSMVSWGLAELGRIAKVPSFTQAAAVTARHYASHVDAEHWLERSGFSDEDSRFPLTHTLGYSIQGFIETGRVCEDAELVDIGQAVLERSRAVINADTGFMPGRVHGGWRGGTNWACLTGCAQFASCFMRLVEMGRGRPEYPDIAAKLVNFVVSTQLPEQFGHPELAWGVRGSYPFSTTGYEPIAQPNWAAKFLVDAELFLLRAGRLA